MLAPINEPLTKDGNKQGSAVPLTLLNDKTLWYPAGRYTGLTLEIDGLGAGTVVQVQTSNAKNPTGATAGKQAGADVTADGHFAIEDGAAWVRLEITTLGTSPSVTARANSHVR